MKKILILDFGSQYTQLIARRVRELELYCEIIPYYEISDWSDFDMITGLILSGSPSSVHSQGAPRLDWNLIKHLPILGICYGAQLFANDNGGEVTKSEHREYGPASLATIRHSDLIDSSFSGKKVWMSHGDSITQLPDGATMIASTSSIPYAAYSFQRDGFNFYGLQFHPEVYHTEDGMNYIDSFVFKICKAVKNWTANNFIELSMTQIGEEVGPSDHVLLGLSGGVDSSVASLLLHRTLGDRLHCFFIDNGLLRQDEFEQVLQGYESLGLNIKGIDAKSEFLSALEGVSDPEIKRKIIGKTFIDVFEREARMIPSVKYLAQGTIYPDVIESVSVSGPSVSIKSHHNVGGLPERMELKIIEPLKMLFKDEVRRVGAALELPNNILNRHPFPGPGLAIRILGEINHEKVSMLQKADKIYTDVLKKHGWYNKIWQAGAILLPIKSVGVMGDERTYEQVIALRAVWSTDGMTAEWSPIPYEILGEISSTIINQVKGINRVVYDISTKPPATIEWE